MLDRTWKAFAPLGSIVCAVIAFSCSAGTDPRAGGGTPPDPVDADISYVGVEAPVTYVGTHTVLRAIVHAKSTDRVGAGVRVRWHAFPNGGVFDDTVSFTDARGQSDMGYLPPTQAGDLSYEVIAGNSVRDTIRTGIIHGPVTKLLLSRDSVRFTRVGTAAIRAQLADQYDNVIGGPNEPISTVLQVRPTTGSGEINGVFARDTLYVNSGTMPARGALELVRRSDGAVLDAVQVLGDLFIAAVRLTGGLGDSGLSVGETYQYAFTALDSGGAALKVSAIDAGVQFTSADVSIASVTNMGVVKGEGVGSTAITASRGDSTNTLPVTVVAGYDLGAFTPLYPIWTSEEGRRVLPVLFAPSGASVFVNYTWQTHPTGPGSMSIVWYAPDGSFIRSRAFNENGQAVMSDGTVYVSYPVSRYDAAGNLMWSASLNATSILADPNLVVAGENGRVSALDSDGKPAWSFTSSGDNHITALTPTRVFVVIIDGTSRYLMALSRSGQLLWRVPNVGCDLADAETGMCFGLGGNTLTAVGPDGATRWSYNAALSYLPVALAPNSTVVVATDGKLLWLDRTTGAERFSVSESYISPYIVAIGNRLLVQSYGRESYLMVHDATTGALLGRSTVRAAGQPTRPVCTSLGLMLASPIQVGRFASCP